MCGSPTLVIRRCIEVHGGYFCVQVRAGGRARARHFVVVVVVVEVGEFVEASAVCTYIHGAQAGE